MGRHRRSAYCYIYQSRAIHSPTATYHTLFAAQTVTASPNRLVTRNTRFTCTWQQQQLRPGSVLCCVIYLVWAARTRWRLVEMKQRTIFTSAECSTKQETGYSLCRMRISVVLSWFSETICDHWPMRGSFTDLFKSRLTRSQAVALQYSEDRWNLEPLCVIRKLDRPTAAKMLKAAVSRVLQSKEILSTRFYSVISDLTFC